MIAAVVFSSELQRVSSPEQEEGIIPDSPVLHSSLPVANKLRKHRRFDKSTHVRYTEKLLRKSNKPLFSGQCAHSKSSQQRFYINVFFVFPELDTEAVDATKNVRTAEVLVPNTCEYDSSQTSGVKSATSLFLKLKPWERQMSDFRWRESPARRTCSRNVRVWTFQQTSDGKKKQEMHRYWTFEASSRENLQVSTATCYLSGQTQQ